MPSLLKTLRPCPKGHDSTRVIGGPSMAAGGNTEAEAVNEWNSRCPVR
jgi:hypothetical protein